MKINHLAALTFLLAASVSFAVKPQSWSHSSASDFTTGKFDNLIVDSQGQLALGRALTPLTLDGKTDSISAFTQTSDGQLFLASDGKILRLDDSQTSPLYSAPKTFPDITALATSGDSHLLVALSGDYAQLLKVPTKTKDAPATLWQDKSVETIWAILPAPGDITYLATGPKAAIYKLDAAGKAESIFQLKSGNILSLALDKSGNLIAGTDASNGSALVIRLDKTTAKPFVLLESEDADITALVSDDAGNLYVATAGTDADSASPRSHSRDSDDAEPAHKSKPALPEPDTIDLPDDAPLLKKKTTRIDLRDHSILALEIPDDNLQKALESLRKAGVAPSSSRARPKTPASRPSPSKPGKNIRKKSPSFEENDTSGSAVYKISPDNIVTKIVSQPDANYALLLTKNELLIGTGMSGKLFAYSPADETLALIARIPQEQISALFAAKNGTIFVGAANTGAAYSLSPNLASSGTFTSEILDAKHTARFGTATLTSSLPPDTKATIAFRSGNIKESPTSESKSDQKSDHKPATQPATQPQSDFPDPQFWSPWSAELSSSATIPAPAARYLQYRITLTSTGKDLTPTISSAKLVYQIDNFPPVLKSIIVEHSTPGISDPAPDNAPDRTTDNDDKTPLIQIAWQAADPNNDVLSHRLYYRSLTAKSSEKSLAESPWLPLAKDLKEPEYEWDTRALPDGSYQIKVVTTDAPDNSPATARTLARESAPFLIDHTPPTRAPVKATLKGPPVTVSGTAADAAPPNADVRFQIDGTGDWQPASPSDKIFDSPQEAFTVATRPLAAGNHRITIRATDAHGNSAFENVTVTIK